MTDTYIDKGFYKGDVDKAEQQIRAAVPDVQIDRQYHGFGLEAYRAIEGDHRSVTVFQPGIADKDIDEIITPVENAIKFLLTGEKPAPETSC